MIPAIKSEIVCYLGSRQFAAGSPVDSSCPFKNQSFNKHIRGKAVSPFEHSFTPIVRQGQVIGLPEIRIFFRLKSLCFLIRFPSVEYPPKPRNMFFAP